jgi:hypothetical protein
LKKFPYEPHTVFDHVPISEEVSKNCENLADSLTKFDMGFQKINMRSRSEKVDFFNWVIFRRTATKDLNEFINTYETG